MAGARFGVVLDIVVPVGLYYACSGLGYSDRVGLLAAAVGAAALALISLVRTRRLDALPIVVALAALISLAVGFLSGSARLLLVREAYVGIPMGIMFIASTFTGDPVLNKVYRAILVTNPEKDARWLDGLATNAWFRRRLKIMTALWGVVGIVGSLAQVVIAYTFPLHTAVPATNLTVPAIVVVASLVCTPTVRNVRDFLDGIDRDPAHLTATNTAQG